MATISRLLKVIGLVAEYSLIYRALLQKRRIILRSLLIVATSYQKSYGRVFTTEPRHQDVAAVSNAAAEDIRYTCKETHTRDP